MSQSAREVKDASYIPGVFSQGEAACLDLARIRCLSLPAKVHKLTAEAETEVCVCVCVGGGVVLQMDSSEENRRLG